MLCITNSVLYPEISTALACFCLFKKRVFGVDIQIQRFTHLDIPIKGTLPCLTGQKLQIFKMKGQTKQKSRIHQSKTILKQEWQTPDKEQV